MMQKWCAECFGLFYYLKCHSHKRSFNIVPINVVNCQRDVLIRTKKSSIIPTFRNARIFWARHFVVLDFIIETSKNFMNVDTSTRGNMNVE